MSEKKILIVDDDVDFLASTKVVLESKGYKVFSALNKEEGREGVSRLLPELIIMDVMMDKMSDGFDLSRELKSTEKFKNIPILMVTAVGEKTGFEYSADMGDSLWLPVDDFAKKPLEPKQLIEKVEKLLADKPK